MSTPFLPTTGDFCWNELMTPHTAQAQAFYTSLMGWTAQTHEMPDMSYTLFMMEGKRVGGMMETPKEYVGKVPPHWLSYICVEDVEKTLEKAIQLGASIKAPVTEVPNMGRFCVVADPTGASIAFWQVLNAS